MTKYLLSSTCNSAADGANTVMTYPTSCTANNANTVAYGDYYLVRKVGSSIMNTDYTVSYTVKQEFSGITLSTYNANQASIESVLRKVIATVITGTTSSNVKFVKHYDPYATRRRLTAVQQEDVQLQESSTVRVHYTVHIPSIRTAGYASASDAFNQTKSQLKTSVRAGAFTDTMVLAANQSGVSVLMGVEANTVPTVSEYSSSKIESKKNIPLTGIIVGVVVGVVVLIVATLTGFFKARNTAVKPKYGVVLKTSLENTQQQQQQLHQLHHSVGPHEPTIPPGTNFV
jgi:hypothetical protein